MQTAPPLRPAGSARLFLALWPDAATRTRLAAQRDALRLPEAARPVSDANLHATLHFIGAFECERIPALWTALARVPARPVCLRATTLATWKGGTVVLLFEPDAGLGALHADTGSVLRACGIALDPRPFSPHVTLARGASGLELPSTADPLAWRATHIALVESSGGTYRVLAARDVG